MSECFICEPPPTSGIVEEMSFDLCDTTVVSEVTMCTTCGLTRLNPFPPEDLLTKHYAGQHRYPSETVAYKEQADMLEKYVGLEDAAVCDVGAYDGRLLKELSKRGVSRLVGVEPDRTVKKKFSYVTSPTLETAASMYRSSMDIVTLGHVLEHLRDPLKVMEQVWYILKPGGTVFIEVPDIIVPQVQIVPYWTPFHLWYFSQHTLEWLFENTGFNSIAVDFTGYGSVRVIGRKFKNIVDTGFVPPPRPTLTAIAGYKLHRGYLLKDVERSVGHLQGKTFAIFGAGDHTKWLLKEFPFLNGYDYILDSNPAKWEDKVIPPDMHRPGVPVVISSYDTQDEMAEMVGKDAIKLYSNVKAYDVWKGEDAGISVQV